MSDLRRLSSVTRSCSPFCAGEVGQALDDVASAGSMAISLRELIAQPVVSTPRREPGTKREHWPATSPRRANGRPPARLVGPVSGFGPTGAGRSRHRCRRAGPLAPREPFGGLVEMTERVARSARAEPNPIVIGGRPWPYQASSRLQEDRGRGRRPESARIRKDHASLRRPFVGAPVLVAPAGDPVNGPAAAALLTVRPPRAARD